ncbi:PIN domain-containing protein [Halonotius roseus]|uniref:Ribonuclease VapC n=1 Tax=Halonotius roseus TaxID=2511997 RepID=A0A544QLN3_9EURY|nr:PIN domain-containing protein [Halonotius roseus]TQQ79482.1 type II toxin-antitoxin system VapC family toxin [Halonotius roseus]
MVVYDSSVLIDYLDGDTTAVEYVETHADQQAVAPPLVLFELYRGEIFTAGEPEFDTVDAALQWVDIIETDRTQARVAAAAESELHQQGIPLSARDAFIAGTAKRLNQPLAVSDGDFDVDGINDVLTVDML